MYEEYFFKFIPTEPEKGKSKATVKLPVDHLFPKALDGFVFILSREGDIVYVSESVAKYLGIQQVNVVALFLTCMKQLRRSSCKCLISPVMGKT